MTYDESLTKLLATTTPHEALVASRLCRRLAPTAAEQARVARLATAVVASLEFAQRLQRWRGVYGSLGLRRTEPAIRLTRYEGIPSPWHAPCINVEA